MTSFSDLEQALAEYLEPEVVEKVRDAYDLAAKAHAGQRRISGEDYITHPIEVCLILASMRMDRDSIIAAMLHDVLEDTSVTKLTLAEAFGQPVADLVDGVSKLQQMHFESRLEAQAENFRKMLLAMAKDIRVILIKLADRLHNMRTLEALTPDKRRRIARETLEIYAPISNRLGMNYFRMEFEDLGFAALYPMRQRVLSSAVKRVRGNQREIMGTILQALRDALERHHFVIVDIDGREKHLYSIYRKMRTKHLSFSEIMDVYAFRIILDSREACYRCLGHVHSLYKPVPGRFKDYIALPKANGYQSLHTILFGPHGLPIEIQIRSEEMHRMAQRGIAAHWLYKSPQTSISKAQSRARLWLDGLLEMQNRAGTSQEFIEHVKTDLFPEDIYVFTPGGDILELPAGATGVDFAYCVHTDIGNSCVAVRVDRRLAPLSTVLVSGQTVEIITAPGACPNPAWLTYVVTGKAKSNIRHFLKGQKRQESVALGLRLLESALETINSCLADIPQAALEATLRDLGAANLEGLYEQVGLGDRLALLVARQMILHTSSESFDAIDSLANEDIVPLVIKGTEGVVVRFGQCCWPIPGDPIVGQLNAGEGLTIHLEDCEKTTWVRDDPASCVPVRWQESIAGEFLVEVTVEVVNQRGILATLTGVIADAAANIDTISSEGQDDKFSTITLILAVRDRAHLARIIRRIRGLRAVSKVSRTR